MKLKFIYIISAVGMLVFGSCADEATITNGASQEQIDASSKAKEAMVNALPAFGKNYATLGTTSLRHYDWGYGSVMHVRDVMTNDLATTSSYDSWYQGWGLTSNLSENSAAGQFVWNYYYAYVLNANLLIKSIDEATTNSDEKGFLGVGLTYRAFLYIDLARLYEFLPNDKTKSINSDGKDVLNLTVPIVTEKTTEQDAGNNPRVSREEMYNFILSDLDKAESLIVDYKRSTKTQPNLAVVYGLKARLYMWVENYPKAQEYARKAIDESAAQPMTETQWNSTTKGFNDLSVSSWMWGTQMTSEDDVVKSGILNWTSWMSPEAPFGYSGAGAVSMIGVELYNKIDDQDFRKYSFVAPADSKIADKVNLIRPDRKLLTYAGVKFRPNDGNIATPTVGAASAYPLMRVEEMYLIEAEAAAQQNPTTGKTLIVDFVNKYRYPSYSFSGTSKEDIIDEIFLQKRIEFWGEGVVFFDYKRLNKPVVRGYVGTNFLADRRFNTTTRPAWMNFVIVLTEGNNNDAVSAFNNPDPSMIYEPWTPLTPPATTEK